MFGHRADGKRLSDIDPIVRITPYMMPMRCDAMVFLEHRLDYEMLARYIAQKAREDQKVTFMQIIVAAYVRGISQHPEVVVDTGHNVGGWLWLSQQLRQQKCKRLRIRAYRCAESGRNSPRRQACV